MPLYRPARTADFQLASSRCLQRALHCQVPSTLCRLYRLIYYSGRCSGLPDILYNGSTILCADHTSEATTRAHAIRIQVLTKSRAPPQVEYHRFRDATGEFATRMPHASSLSLATALPPQSQTHAATSPPEVTASAHAAASSPGKASAARDSVPVMSAAAREEVCAHALTFQMLSSNCCCIVNSLSSSAA